MCLLCQPILGLGRLVASSVIEPVRGSLLNPTEIEGPNGTIRCVFVPQEAPDGRSFWALPCLKDPREDPASRICGDHALLETP